MTPTEKQQAFYEALGRAISQWASVEMGLFEVFCELTKIPDREVASAIFFSGFGFGNKLTLTNAAASVLKEDRQSLASEWKNLDKEARTKSTTRNDLAHYMAIIMASDDFDRMSMELRPNIFNVKQEIAFQSGNKQGYNTKKLIEAAKSFGRFSMKLHGFAYLLRGEKAPWHDQFHAPEAPSS